METSRVGGIDIRKIHDFGIGTYIRHLLDGLSQSNQTMANTVFRLYTETCYNPDPAILPPIRFPVVTIASGKKAPMQGSLPGASDLAFYHAPHYLTPDPGDVPLILTVHDCIHIAPPRFPDSFDRLGNPSDHIFDAAKRLYHRGQGFLRFRKLVKKAQEIITVSDATSDILVELTGVDSKKITRIHNCVDDGFFTETSDQNLQTFCEKFGLTAKDYFLYCGNDLYHKNLAGLLTAWKNLSTEITAPKLVLAGPPRQVMIREFVENLGISDHVVLLDRLPAANLRGLYQGARAIILPSLAEGFGLPVAEAMAMQVPVICSDISVLREITGGNAFYFDPYHPPSIASGIREFMDSPSVAEKHVAQAAVIAKGYSSRSFISAHIDVYRRVLEVGV